MYKFSFFDIWPYFIIAAFFLLCYAYKLKNSSKIIFFVLLFFCVFRYDVGWDYMTYVDELKEGLDSISQSRYEPLSKFVFYLSSLMDFYPFAFFFFALITLYLVYKSINLFSINCTISWLVYYSLPLFFFASLSTIRQSIATAIILFSYKYLRDNNKIKYLVSIIIATLFHTSGIAGLLLWPVLKVPINRRISFIILFTSFLFPLYIEKIIISIIDSYFSGFEFANSLSWYLNAENRGTSILQYLYYFFGIFNLLFYNKLINLAPENRTYINLVTFGIVIFNLLSFEPISATRLSAFFLIFLIYIIPYYPFLFPKYVKVIRTSIFILLLAISFFYLWIYINAYANHELDKISFIPYKFWFMNL